MAECSKSSIVAEESPDIFFDSQDFMDDFEEIPPAPDIKTQSNWRGASMTVIYGGDNPWIAPEFPDIVPGYNHAVLYHISKTNPKKFTSNPPSPQQGKDVWDKDYVRMPYSSQSYYPVEKEGTTVLENRWKLIVRALSKPITDSRQLEAAILEYNSKYRQQWNFSALHKLFDEYLEEEETDFFFASTLPKIQKLALSLPEIIPSSIPLLRRNKNKSISLSQWQVACLLANAFFCTFPRRNSQNRKSEYSTFPDINFNNLFQSKGSRCVLEKLKCICHYFRRIFHKVPSGVITFTRHCVANDNLPDWSKSNVLIDSVPLHVNSKGTIEDEGLGLMQVDFANKFLGGGVLNHGCVQEEIRFVICPELLVSMLFTEVLNSNEAVLIIGAERYSNYSGYANTFKWDDDHIDNTLRDSNGRLRCAIIAIDAVSFSNKKLQYHPDYVIRELNKAYVGYSVHINRNSPNLSLPGVATGNWGCGAFSGSPHLKALIQLMACCASRRPMAYFTFGDNNLKDDIVNMYNMLSENKITIGKLFSYLSEFNKSSLPESQLYPFLLQIHKDKESVKSCKASTSKINAEIVSESGPFTVSSENGSKNEQSTTESMDYELEIIDDASSSEFISKNSQSHQVNESVSKDQLTSKPTLFDSISSNSESTFDGNVPKKKRSLLFFDKGSTKSDKSVENGTTPIKKESSESQNRAKVTTTPKTGKISDYFQVTPKITKK